MKLLILIPIKSLILGLFLRIIKCFNEINKRDLYNLVRLNCTVMLFGVVTMDVYIFLALFCFVTTTIIGFSFRHKINNTISTVSIDYFLNRTKAMFSSRQIRIQWIAKLLLLIDIIVIYYFAFVFDSINETSWFSMNGIKEIAEKIEIYFDEKIDPLKWKEKMALIAPITALGVATIFHRLDKAYNGGGLVDLLRDSNDHKNSYNINPDVIAATMQKQSILAAIAAIMIGIIQGAIDKKPGFAQVAAEISMGGFMLSMLLLFISILCYDYANRFNLTVAFKARLVGKGLTLDIFSWYLVLFSFTTSIGVINVTLSIITCTLSGIVLTWYYFLDKGSKPSSSPLQIGSIEKNLDSVQADLD